MGAPSKEEIDREVEQCRAMDRKFPVTRCDPTGVIVAIADENERMRAENDRLMADALARQTTEIVLRAERSEVLAQAIRLRAALEAIDQLIGGYIGIEGSFRRDVNDIARRALDLEPEGKS